MVDERLGQIDGAAGAAADRAEIRRGLGLRIVFIGGEEEQFVLDDRAANGETPGLFFEGTEIGVIAGRAIEALADGVVVAIDVSQAAVELVGAGFGDGIDVGAGVTFLGYVVVGDIEIDFLDRVDRDRLFRGGQVVGLKAEGVAGVDAVDGHRVVAGILAAGGDFAALFVGLRNARIETRVILQVATDRSEGIDLVAGHVAAGAHLVGAEDHRTGGAGDGDGIEILRADREIDLRDLIQREVDVVFAAVARAFLVGGDLVRTADAQTAGVVATVVVGDDAADRARFAVHDGDFSAGDRLTIGSNDLATYSGGGVLRERRCRRKGDDQSDRQFRKSETVRMVHFAIGLDGKRFDESYTKIAYAWAPRSDQRGILDPQPVQRSGLG